MYHFRGYKSKVSLTGFRDRPVRPSLRFHNHLLPARFQSELFLHLRYLSNEPWSISWCMHPYQPTNQQGRLVVAFVNRDFFLYVKPCPVCEIEIRSVRCSRRAQTKKNREVDDTIRRKVQKSRRLYEQSSKFTCKRWVVIHLITENAWEDDINSKSVSRLPEAELQACLSTCQFS